MAGNLYQDGLFVAQGRPEYVNEEANALTGQPFAGGQLGKEITLPDPPNSGALAPKTWKFVQRKAAGAAMNTRGTIVEYNAGEETSFVVELAAGSQLVAGVFNGDDNATDVLTRGMQVGNYGFIQVAGECTVTSTAAAIAVGDAVMSAGNGLVVKATAGTPVIGVALTAVGGGGGTLTILLDVPRICR